MKFMTKMAQDAARQIKTAERGGLLDEALLGMNRDDPSSALSILPFGSSYVGYARGADDDRRLEGVVRGALGGTGGTLGGAFLGALPGAALRHHGLAQGGALTGGALGNILGTHLATRGLVDEE